MITPDSPFYRNAFVHYLRTGTPIDISLKALLKARGTKTPLYVWRTVGDDKVRSEHALNEGYIFSRDNPPATGNPGEAINCRCTAEPYTPEPGLDGFYPELLFLPGGFIVRRIGGEIIRRVLRNEAAPGRTPEKPRLDNTKTWPKPPREGKYREGNPSRTKPRSRGEKSLYDEKGGEWRYDPGDKYHNPHWNYKPSGKMQEWKNISINGLPPRK